MHSDCSAFKDLFKKDSDDETTAAANSVNTDYSFSASIFTESMICISVTNRSEAQELYWFSAILDNGQTTR